METGYWSHVKLLFGRQPKQEICGVESEKRERQEHLPENGQRRGRRVRISRWAFGSDGRLTVRRVENLRPGNMDRLRLGYEDLRKVNKGIILASTSGIVSTL